MLSLVRSGEECQETQAWNEQVQRSKEYRHHNALRRLQDKISLLIEGKEKKTVIQL